MIDAVLPDGGYLHIRNRQKKSGHGVLIKAATQKTRRVLCPQIYSIMILVLLGRYSAGVCIKI
jgi:hypothetical protein